MALGPHSVKGSGELGVVRNLLDGVSPYDVMPYWLIATLMTRGVPDAFNLSSSAE